MAERRRKVPGFAGLATLVAAPVAAYVALITAVPAAAGTANMLPPAPSGAPGGCSQDAAAPAQVITETPWQQRWLSPQQVWPLSTGAGVRVAVIDSGVDAAHTQLAGAVQGGLDVIAGGGGGTLDCVGHGTAVASIIAARPVKGVGFQGLAPQAQIVPVRVTERDGDDQGAMKESVDSARFAQAIRWAADQGIRVVNLSIVMYTPSADVEAAVRYALSKNSVLIAAVGNKHRTDGQPDPTPYPAAYPGVIGVGAIDERGNRVNDSQVGPYVDLVAPGGAVTAATRGAGHQQWSGTSFAAPMVAAAAALVLSAEPSLTADQVAGRLAATADPARGGVPSEAYGRGIVNLYRAVSERLNTQLPAALAPAPELTSDAAAQARDRHRAWLGRTAVAVAGALVAVALVVAVAAVAVPRGRRVGWRPVRAARLVTASASDSADADRLAEEFVRLPVGRGR